MTGKRVVARRWLVFAGALVAACGYERPADVLGDAAAGPLHVEPAGQELGMLEVGQSNRVQFHLRNPTERDVDTADVRMTSGDAQDFGLMDNQCSGLLRAQSECTFELEFAPKSAGSKLAVYDVRADGALVRAVTVTGTGLGAVGLAVAPTSHDFGSVTMGGSSGLMTFVVTNTGGAPSGPIMIEPPPPPEGFQILSSFCTGPLVAGESCNFTMRFEPVVLGTRVIAISIMAFPGGTVSVAVSGTGQP